VRRDEHDVYDVAQSPPLPADAAVVIEALSPLVTAARKARLEAVAARRSRAVVPVLEELTDPHNASAILRSADAFGVQEVHAVPGEHGLLAAHRVSKGTHRWLDIVRHRDAESCVHHLRRRGYDIAVAIMDGELRPEDLRAKERVAVVFGNEHRGASGRIRELADATYAVPMSGFAESLNVSVAAAVTLYVATAGREPDLSDAERQRLLASFLMRSVRDAERVVREHVHGGP